MKRGFALVIALAFFVLAGALTTILLIFGSAAGAEARLGLEMQAARRAAEAGIRIAEEREGQYASRTYFSDPIEAYYWYGGDLPAGGFRPDGILANDGEILGRDYGMDGLPDQLEPGFIVGGDLAAGGGALAQDLDPSADDLVPGDFAGPAIAPGNSQLAGREGNLRYDGPMLQGGVGPKIQMVGKLPGQALSFLGTDDATGPDNQSSQVEFRQDYVSPGVFAPVGYHPIGNCDPGGDDYHPIFNPQGLEGKVVVTGAPPAATTVATVERADSRFRRYVHKIGPLAQFEEGNLKGFCSVRAIDTSTRIDLNGASFHTARMIQSLIQQLGSAPGPITVENRSIGYNGRGIEASRPVPAVLAGSNPPMVVNSSAGPAPLGVNAWNVLDWPQFPLYGNPAFHNWAWDLSNPLPPPLIPLNPAPPPPAPPFVAPPWGPANFGPNIFYPPKKIASSKPEEDLYFSQPVNQIDPDAVAIVKYRNQFLGGKFTSVEQLLQVRRFDGSPIFTERDRDELERLSDYLTIEAWRDPQTLSHRNGDHMMDYSDVNPVDGIPDTFQWSPYAIQYRDPEPWQDLIPNGIFEGGERFDDFGFDQLPSNAVGLGAGDDEADLLIRKTDPLLGAYNPFTHPDPSLDDFNTIWNPFFIRSFTYSYVDLAPVGLGVEDINPQLFGVPGNALTRSVRTPRYGTQAWSPFMYTRYTGGLPLSHLHYSDPSVSGSHPSFALAAGVVSFNYDALEGNGFLDLDPYEIDPNPLPATAGGLTVEPVPAPGFSIGPANYGPYSIRGFMWNEHWNPLAYAIPTGLPPGNQPRTLPNYDYGIDQLNSLYFPGSPLMIVNTGGNYNPGLPWPDAKDEFYYNLSNINAIDPDIDNADFASALISNGGCSAGGVTTVFGMVNPGGTEGNLRFDPYPEIGWWVFNSGFTHDLPYNDNLYSSFFAATCGTPTNLFLMPRFSPLPLSLDFAPPGGLDILEPPRWARPDRDWYVEPGEYFGDDGRDRLRYTGDYGEGNGMWDPGEFYNDVGIDNDSMWEEQAFQNQGLTIPVSNCNFYDLATNGVPPNCASTASPGDHHAEDFSSLSGAQRGSEIDGRFNFLREPYLDLNRDGRWNRGFTILETNGGFAQFGGLAATPNPLGAFRDRNGDRLYDHGIFREPRAPININAAPEEVLAAAIYEGLIYPAKKKRDRFCLVVEDFFQSGFGFGASSAADDYDWRTVIFQTDGSGRLFRPDYSFAHSLSRGLARAIWLRRMGLYNPSNAALVIPIGSGPFRTWTEFETFVTTLLNTPAETSRFDATLGISIHPQGACDAFGQALQDPFAMAIVGGYPSPALAPLGNLYAPLVGAAAVRQLMIDRIVVQANPNTRIRGTGDYSYQNQSQFDKTDFPFPTSEFCFGPTGIFEFTSVGYAVATATTPTKGAPVAAQVIGSGASLSSPDLLSSFDVRASFEVKKTVKLFDHMRLSTRSDFEGTHPSSRGVSILPTLAEDRVPTPESQVSMKELNGPSTTTRTSTYQLQTTYSGFLFVEPEVTIVDSAKNLIFSASSAPFGTPLLTPWNDQAIGDPGGRIQIFYHDTSPTPGFTKTAIRTAPSNNGYQFRLSKIDIPPKTPWQRFGIIEPGNGFENAAQPTIRAMAFDSSYPRPDNFPDLNAYGGTWKALVDPAYTLPIEVNYLGRLYVLDDQAQRLRAIDVGNDGTGGLITQEVPFADPAGVSYGGVGLKIQVMPSRREVWVLTQGPAGIGNANVYLRRLRYPEGVKYPATLNVAGIESSLLTWVEPAVQVPGLTTVDVVGAAPDLFPLPAFLVKDEATNFLYVGGTITPGFAPAPNDPKDVRIYRCNPDASPFTFDQVFPWTANFLPPGYRNIFSLPPIAPGISANHRRELVGLEIDPGSGLLMALWNLTLHRPSALAGVPVGFESNGSGAYLAAIPTGAAPFLGVPLMNPFPMVLTQPYEPYFDFNGCAVPPAYPNNTFPYPGDKYPIYAAAMALDPVQKTLLIAPREQPCESWTAPDPGAGICASVQLTDPNNLNGQNNPLTMEKNIVAVVTYGGDGLRTADVLNPFQIRTDNPYDPNVLPAGNPSTWSTNAAYIAAPGGNYGPSRARPKPLDLTVFPGRNLFLLSLAAPYETLVAGNPKASDGQCSLIPYNPTAAAPVYWSDTRSLRLFEVTGFNYGQGNTPVDHWQDGKLVAKTHAPPLSAFRDGQAVGAGAIAQIPWIHSRANFESGAFFMAPEYSRTNPNPTIPISYRPLPCQTNARVTGEGLYVDSSIAVKPVDLNGIPAVPPAPEEWQDQRIYYPQDGVIQDRVLQGAFSEPSIAPATINRENVRNGWGALENATEFWVRFGDLQAFANNPFPAGIILYEKFTKVKAQLQEQLPSGQIDFTRNPFIGDASVAPGAQSAAMLSRLTNILAADAVLGQAPLNVTNIQYFFPDAMDVWVYDKIYLTGFVAGPPLTANFVYERRMAAPAGAYPGVFRGPDLVPSGKHPWGTMKGLPFPGPGPDAFPAGDLATLKLAGEDFLYPFADSMFPLGTHAMFGLPTPPANALIEKQKYAVVKADGQLRRFVPIWSNSNSFALNPRVSQAAARYTANNIRLISDGWMHVAFGGKVRFDPDSNPATLMVPDTTNGATRLLIWDASTSNLVTQTIPPNTPITAPIPDWYDFPGDREGFLAFGATQCDVNGRPTAGYPGGGATDYPPTMGGLIFPNFSYLVDDITFYERPDPVTGFGNASAQRNNIVRFSVGESGWPTGLDGVNNGSFPNNPLPANAIAASPYLAAEPFLDFNNDGVRTYPGSVIPLLPQNVSFWDMNGNGRWDFEDTPAYPGDLPLAPGVLPGLVNSLFGMPIGGAFGEPFQDLNNDGIWNNRGDLFIDLNDNGVLDGEPFLDGNGNGILDPADPVWNPLNDRNGNGIWDGGEPFIDTQAGGFYTARLGEPFVNRDANSLFNAATETFFDENFNGSWNSGEPFVSWSRQGAPQGGELYRENGLSAGFQSDALIAWNANFGSPAGAAPLSPTGFPYRNQAGNTWISAPQSLDWNNDGRYEGAGVFEGVFPEPLPPGSRVGSLAFTVWRPQIPSLIDVQGRISVDLEFHAKDGRFLGRWSGVDNLSVDTTANRILFRDESGIGMPISVETIVKYRINFYMPNTRVDVSDSSRNTSSPILDDLSFTVILPQQNQIVYENCVTEPVLIQGYEKGILQ